MGDEPNLQFVVVGAPAPPPSIQPVGDQVFEAGKEGIRKRVVSELHTTEVSYRDGLSLIIKVMFSFLLVIIFNITMLLFLWARLIFGPFYSFLCY